jgi:hypothetical protein
MNCGGAGAAAPLKLSSSSSIFSLIHDGLNKELYFAPAKPLF